MGCLQFKNPGIVNEELFIKLIGPGTPRQLEHFHQLE